MCISMHGTVLSSLLLLAAACGASAERDWTPLTDTAAWTAAEADEDPLFSHRPSRVDCEPPAWREEFGAIEVDTGACNYLSLRQPALAALARGDEIQLSAWWQTLAHVESATGHLAIFAGADLLWEEEIAIPGPADARALIVRAPADYPAGTPITLHLHNHGHNTWNFDTLSVRR